VAKERLKSPRARLFVALTLPEDVREALVRWQEAALGDRTLRPTRAEALHMTLVFLGYLPEREIGRLGELVASSRSEAPEIRLAPDPVPIPPRRPRLLALDAESEGATAIQAGLSARLCSVGLYRPEKRPFWPHLTVARVRPEKRGAHRPARVERLPGRLPDSLLSPFRAVRMTLYRSHLRPGGARYESVANIELPSPDG
jgi:2'-5' RNA ligase